MFGGISAVDNRAYVWEFGRLNLTNTFMSKRKLKHLVKYKII